MLGAGFLPRVTVRQPRGAAGRSWRDIWESLVRTSVGRQPGAARESESLSQAELVLRGKCGSRRRGWGASVLSDFPEMFPQRAGKGRGEGKGAVLPLPELIITWQVGGAAVATRAAVGLLSWCL